MKVVSRRHALSISSRDASFNAFLRNCAMAPSNASLPAQNCTLETHFHLNSNCRGSTTNHNLARDIGPDYKPPLEIRSLSGDPALIVVALILTVALLLVGFSASVCSGHLWKCHKRPTNSKPAATNPGPIEYIRPTTITPFPYAMASTSPRLHHLPVQSEFISPSPQWRVSYADRQDGQRPASYPVARPKTWSQGAWGLTNIRDATTSSVKLFSVPEVDEEQESDQPVESPDILDEVDPEDEQQETDGSHSSSTEETDIGTELFDTTSAESKASLTTVENSQGDTEEDETEPETSEDSEEVFEVKRGQTHSIELVKGVLVVVPPDSSPAKEDREPDIPLPAENKKEVIQKPSTLPNIHRVQRPSSPQAPGLLDDRPQVPTLLVTEPSTFSLFTVGSSVSEMSLDIGKFPLPPLHLEPTVFWQKLEEEINQNMAIKRRS